jgi:hypothetical protein
MQTRAAAAIIAANAYSASAGTKSERSGGENRPQVRQALKATFPPQLRQFGTDTRRKCNGQFSKVVETFERVMREAVAVVHAGNVHLMFRGVKPGPFQSYEPARDLERKIA